MDSDILNMMMQQMEKLPEFCNPNPNSQSNPSSNFFSTNQNNTYPFLLNQNQTNLDHSINQEPSFRYSTGLLTTQSSNFQDKRVSNNNNMAAMREMIFRMAVMQPIHIDPEAVKPPKRRNVRISKDPQSVAARHRREKISERIRILQRLVPGGTKMDTASMLDEAIHYVKFLKQQVQTLEEQAAVGAVGTVGAVGGNNNGVVMKGCGGIGAHQIVANAQILR